MVMNRVEEGHCVIDNTRTSTSWFHASRNGTGTKKFLSATFKVSDVHDILDLNNMTGMDFMKTAVEWLNKQRVEKNMVPSYITGYTASSGKQRNFYINYKFEGEDVVVDGTDVEFHDFGRDYRWKSPFFVIRSDLALEMGWFKRKNPPPDDPRFGLELGPNLVMELRDGVLPTPGDLRYKWDADGTGGEAQVTDTYWFIQ